MSFRLYDLNPEQYDAAVHGEGPLLILAGAGTGKTRVITARVAWLLSQGVLAEQILAVTFTNKAAREMQSRIASAVTDQSLEGLTVCTFHSLCVRVLRKHAHLLGYKNNFSIYDESDQSGLIKKIITRTAASDEKLDPALAKNMISKAKNHSWSAPQSEDTLIGSVYARYDQELRQLNAMDFDDLLLNAVRLLAEHAEARDHWAGKYQYLLVDEFQDTNRLQLDLVTNLAGTSQNVCVVGDDDQSIYGWRGAEVSNILEFERHFPNPHIVKLEQNYRSTNPILSTANQLIRNNPRRRAKNLWSKSEGADPIHIVTAQDDREEAAFVVNDIAEKRARGNLRWEDFAVLYRMNAQSRLIEENLRRLQIPYHIVGGKSFFDRREIKDILAYATVLLNSDDDVSMLRIINNPPRGIGATTVEIALEESIKRKCSLYDVLAAEDFLQLIATKTANAIRDFSGMLQGCRITLSMTGTPFPGVFRELIEQSGYIEDLKRACKTEDEADNRTENVMEIFRAMEQYRVRSTEGLRGFIDEMSLDRDKKKEEKDKQSGVTLITLHAAKGLEFRDVYLIGAEDGLLPHERSKGEGTVDEERRLLYVGITRAMRALTITHCASRMKFGMTYACKPSPFLIELESSHIVHQTTKEILSQPVTEEDATSHFDRIREMLRQGASTPTK
ncbi:MAG: UvrD-helicase domain-containing protein [Chthoniobacterales bacterium]